MPDTNELSSRLMIADGRQIAQRNLSRSAQYVGGCEPDRNFNFSFFSEAPVDSIGLFTAAHFPYLHCT